MHVKLLVLATMVTATLAASGDALLGDWRGDSVCQQKNTACQDEKVVYHISAPDSAGKVTIGADKIADGRRIDMGSIVLNYDDTKKTLDGKDGPRVWHFDVKGSTMSGTLTIAGTPIRKVYLRKG